MQQPPPFPKTSSTAGQKFATFATIASFLMLGLLLLVLIIGVVMINPLPPDAKQKAFMVVGAITLLLLVSGLALGVIGICGMVGRERKGMLATAVAGAALNGLLLVGLVALAAIPAFKKAQQQATANREGLSNINQAAAEMRKAAQKELAGGTNRKLSEKKMDDLQKSVQAAADNMTGDQALAMRASAGYVEQLNKLKKELDAATADLTAAKILVAQAISSKEQLQKRREVVQTFLSANERSKNFIAHGAEKYRAELDRWHVPDKLAEDTLRGYRRKADTINPLVVQVRECDGRIATAMLQVIDLEETDWGKWDAQTKPGKILFQNTDSTKQYNAFMADIREASASEKIAQSKLLQASQNFQ